jgi:HAD superfamily phosphoserine phosphatase-like hydrolase
MKKNADRKVIVFDFDKTLTLRDTNWGYFKFAGKQQHLYTVRLIIYLGFLVLRKLKLISNIKLKNIGLSLFLSKKSEKDVLMISEEYAKTIEINNIVKDILKSYHKAGIRVVIATASLTAYVKPIFPEIEVVGSELEYTNKQIRLKNHCYKQNKVEFLQNIGIKTIDVLYTDSISDLPLAAISEEINLVKKSEIVQCNSVDDFIATVETKN